jgi:hypothetical protein
MKFVAILFSPSRTIELWKTSPNRILAYVTLALGIPCWVSYLAVWIALIVVSLSVLLSALAIFAITAVGAFQSQACYFMPCAPQSITDSDQVYALLGGLACLAFEIGPSLWKRVKQKWEMQRQFEELVSRRIELGRIARADTEMGRVSRTPTGTLTRTNTSRLSRTNTAET